MYEIFLDAITLFLLWVIGVSFYKICVWSYKLIKNFQDKLERLFKKLKTNLNNGKYSDPQGRIIKKADFNIEEEYKKIMSGEL